MKHPSLSRKLQLLYSLQLNANVKTNSDLARSLNVSRQAVSRWCRGTASSYGDCIPHYQVAPLAKLFDIEISWLSLQFEKFESNVRERVDHNVDSYLRNKLKVSNSTMPITSLELFGRESELELLDAYWHRKEVNVVQLIAFGGVGKSSLVNRWLSELNNSNYENAECVYAWSFYWQGESSELKSSGDLFIEHALEWFGDENPAVGTPWAKASRLAKLIRERKTLLVLDGLEPLQLGPGARQGQIENPAISCLVRELAENNSGLCLITSRLAVRDLKNYSDGRSKTIDLEHLSKTASIDYLNSLGLTGEREHFEEVSEHYQGHALSLSLLGGFLSVVHEGEIGYFKSIDSLFGDSSLDSHAKNVLSAYLDYFESTDSIKILFLLSLLDRAVELDTLKSISKFSDIDGITSELNQLSSSKWKLSIQKLSNSKLISTKKNRNDLVLDCHPIVRDFAEDYLKDRRPGIWKLCNALLFEYLKENSIEEPKSMQDLEPLFRSVIYGVYSGNEIEAFELYFSKIKKEYLMLTEGSHYSDQKCIRAFFENEWSTPSKSLPPQYQFHLLASASANLMCLGNISEAIEPALVGIESFVKNQMWLEASNTAGPLISMLIAAGKIDMALDLLNDLNDVVARLENPVMTAMADNFKAFSFYLSGKTAEAEVLFQQVDSVLLQKNPNVDVDFPTVSSYYCKFLLETNKPKQALERALTTFGWRRQGAWQVSLDTKAIIASDMIVLGLIFLELGDKINAQKYLDQQIELLKSAGDLLYLPSGLVSRAKLHLAMQNFQFALTDLNEAIDISQKTGAKLAEWEAYLEMSQLFFEQEKYLESHEYLSKALALPNMDKYRFRDAEIVELQETLAKHLPQVEKDERMHGQHIH